MALLTERDLLFVAAINISLLTERRQNLFTFFINEDKRIKANLAELNTVLSSVQLKSSSMRVYVLS